LEETSHGELLNQPWHSTEFTTDCWVDQIANPAFHRSMPVKLFGRLCEKMMLRFEKEGEGLNNVDAANFLQRYTSLSPQTFKYYLAMK
jgi:hypothetical protein